MNTIVPYLLKSIISGGIMMTYYWVFLRNRKFHHYNRFYLLSAIVFSLSFPLLNFSWLNIGPAYDSLNRLLPFFDPDISPEASFPPEWRWTSFACSLFVSAVLLTRLILKVFWIYRSKRNHGHIRKTGFNLIETELRQAPFSFLNNLFWLKSISLDTENGKKIFSHELAHINGKHTYDKLFSQVVGCVFWMNPFNWIIQNELNIIHEFIADEQSLEDGDTGSFARMLLGTYNEGRYMEPSHSFFQPPVYRRLNMVASSRKIKVTKLSRILVFPMVLLVAILFSFTNQKSQNTKAYSLKEQNELVARQKQEFALKKAAEQKQLKKAASNLY